MVNEVSYQRRQALQEAHESKDVHQLHALLQYWQYPKTYEEYKDYFAKHEALDAALGTKEAEPVSQGEKSPGKRLAESDISPQQVKWHRRAEGLEQKAEQHAARTSALLTEHKEQAPSQVPSL